MSDTPDSVLGSVVRKLIYLLKVEIRKRISNDTIFELNEKREGALKELRKKSNVSLTKQGVESFEFSFRFFVS